MLKNTLSVRSPEPKQQHFSGRPIVNINHLVFGHRLIDTIVSSHL